MMLDVHPLHPFQPSSSRKPNRENRIKNACFSNSHSNIAPSNDKRPLFVQILATSSASLVSTSLPIQCLRPTNFFFYRGIFADNFLRSLKISSSDVNGSSMDVIDSTRSLKTSSADVIHSSSSPKIPIQNANDPSLQSSPTRTAKRISPLSISIFSSPVYLCPRIHIIHYKTESQWKLPTSNISASP